MGGRRSQIIWKQESQILYKHSILSGWQAIIILCGHIHWQASQFIHMSNGTTAGLGYLQLGLNWPNNARKGHWAVRLRQRRHAVGCGSSKIIKQLRNTGRQSDIGSFDHQAKIVLKKHWFLLFWDFFKAFYLGKIMQTYLQKVISKKAWLLEGRWWK